MQAAKDELSAFIHSRRPRAWTPEPSVRIGDVSQELARLVDEIDADLMVLGNQTDLDLGAIGLGSSAASTVRHIACNALVVPGDPLGLEDLGSEPILVGRALLDEEE